MVLYTVLVLLPAVVLGALLWRQLTADHENQLSELPRDVRDAAARLSSGIVGKRVAGYLVLDDTTEETTGQQAVQP